MIQTQGLPFSDFSGGVVDEFVNAPPNQAEILHNLICVENKTLKLRKGIDVHQSFRGASEPVFNVFPLEEDQDFFLTFSGPTPSETANRMYLKSYSSPEFSEPINVGVGQGQRETFFDSLPAVVSRVNSFQWQGHIFFNDSITSKLIKVYKINSTTFQAVTAGLPKVESLVYQDVTGSLKETDVIDSESRRYVYAIVLERLYTVFSEEQGDLTYLDVSPVTRLQVTLNGAIGAVDGDTLKFANIRFHMGGPEEEDLPRRTDFQGYDTARTRFAIYRTIAGGSTLRRIHSANTLDDLIDASGGTLFFRDNRPDNLIQDQPVLYTTDGSYENDPPPLCRYVYENSGRAYYAGIYEDASRENKGFEIRQSIPNDPDSVPLAFSARATDTIKGLGGTREIPMVFCENKIYRIQGVINPLGQGSMDLVEIDSSAGCLDNDSIVQVENRVYWAGRDGFYVSDGYSVNMISKHIRTTFRQNNQERIKGVYDSEKERIYWTYNVLEGKNAQAFVIVLNLLLPMQAGMGNFSFFTSNFDLKATDIAMVNRELYIATGDTLLFLNDLKLSDYRVTPQNISNYNSQEIEAIPYKYRSVATNFGSDTSRKWVPRVDIAVVATSDLALQTVFINDVGKIRRPLGLITLSGSFTWRDPNFKWGDPTFKWNEEEGANVLNRRGSVKNLRLNYLQTEFLPGQSLFFFGEGVLASLEEGMWSLTDPRLIRFDSNGKFLRLPLDNFNFNYRITHSRLDPVITFTDEDNNLRPSLDGARIRYRIFRTPESVDFNLLSYTVHWGNMSQSNEFFVRTDSN